MLAQVGLGGAVVDQAPGLVVDEEQLENSGASLVAGKAARVAAAERALLQAANGGKAATELFSAAGCDACSFTGYQGRSGIFELLLIDDESRRLIHDRASEAELLAHARANKMKGLREDGMRWVHAGETSLEEVLRVSRD